MNEDPHNAINDELRAARARQRDIPRDVVPHPEPTDEELLAAYDRLASGRGRILSPGEIVTDADGIPSGIAPPTSEPPAGPPEAWFKPEHRARLNRLLAERDNPEENP